MTWQFTPIAFMYLLAAMINLMTAAINWRRRHIRKGITTLSLILLATGLWLTSWFFEMSAVEPATKQIFLIVEDNIGGLVYVLILFFVQDYFGLWPWLKGGWRAAIWALVALNALAGWTNPLTHWYWTDTTAGPPGSNVVYFNYGPLFQISNVVFITPVIVSFVLLCYQSVRTRGRDRKMVLFITAALAAPFFTYLLFMSLPDSLTGLLAMPFGYSMTALLIHWAVVEDFRYQINEKANSLEHSVGELSREIEKRKALEIDMREFQEALSMRLAAQSSKLSGLYDLILISGQTAALNDLLQICLNKVAAVSSCQALLYFRLDAEQILNLEAYRGQGFDFDTLDQRTPADWFPVVPDVCVDIVGSHSINLPPNLRPAGYRAALYKWVIVQNRPQGVLAAYWFSEYHPAVEEIALFGALTDGLGLIMENARLRHTAASAATIQERRRLARDLHDSVTQSLHSLVLSSQTALEENIEPERLKRILRRLDTSAQQTLKEMRLLLYELRLASPNETGLVDLLNNRLDAVERRAGIKAELRVEPGAAWAKEWETQLYPLAMESLNNALKHARASSVCIRFSGAREHFAMEIQDNGQGFDPAAAAPGGMGLKIMSERCETLGARFGVISGPSAGTTIRVAMLNDENSAGEAPAQETAHG